MVAVAGTMLSPMQWDLWSVLTLRTVASQSLLRQDCGNSGHIDADQLEFVEEKHLLFLVAFLLNSLKAVAHGSADPLL
jgi:hypothetical protein